MLVCSQVQSQFRKGGTAFSRYLRQQKVSPAWFCMAHGEFDLNPMFFGVENGMLDLRSGDLLDPSPDQMISKIGRVFFDKSATAPQFQQFLQQFMPDAEMCGFLQRAVGYTMTGSVDEEVIFFMYGVGANGKSLFGNIIHALLGEYSVSLGAALITKNKHENEAERLKARLPGARLAQINEVAQGDIWDDQRMKELASREPISARYLHKEAFQFNPTHKIMGAWQPHARRAR